MAQQKAPSSNSEHTFGLYNNIYFILITKYLDFVMITIKIVWLLNLTLTLMLPAE